MEWLICNSCFTGIKGHEKPFTLLECGHAYCQKCVAKAEKQCRQCGMIRPPTILLKKPLPEPLVPYFTPLPDFVNKISNCFTFYEGQSRLMMRRFFEIQRKLQIMRAERYRQEQNTEKVKRACDEINQKIRSIKKKMQALEIQDREYSEAKNQRYLSPQETLSRGQRESAPIMRFSEDPQYDSYSENSSRRSPYFSDAMTVNTPSTSGYFLAPNDSTRVPMRPRSARTASSSGSIGTTKMTMLQARYGS